MSTAPSSTDRSESMVRRFSTGKTIIFSLIPLAFLLLIVEVLLAFLPVTSSRSFSTLSQDWPIVNGGMVRRMLSNQGIKGRYNTRMYADYFAFDSTLGVRFRPSVWAYSLEPDEQGFPTVSERLQLAVNEYGYVANSSQLVEAVDYPALATRDDVLRVYTSGGSTTVGWGASNNEKTWPAVLERLLQARLDKVTGHYREVRVINGSVFGYAISQEIKRFLEEATYLKPQVVVAFNGINERWGYEGNPVDYTLRKEQRSLMDPANLGTHFEMPLLFPYLRRAIYRMARPAPVAPESVYGYKREGYLQLSDQTLYIEKARQYHALCHADGIEFIHVLQPVMGIGSKTLTADEERVKNYMGTAFYAPWSVYLRRAEAFYAGAREELQQPWQHDMSTLFDDIEESVYLDPRHYNDLGNERIAEAVCQLVWQSEVLQSSLESTPAD